jgi:FMN reductase
MDLQLKDTATVPRILTVVGSVTPPGRLRRAVGEANDRLRARQAIETATIDLGDLTLAFADGRAPEAFADDTAQAVQAIRDADSVLIATPVYRGSFTGALKNLLDQTPVDALFAKPTGIVSMGATLHHFLGADRHLRDVLAFYGALVAPVSVYLTSSDFVDGVPSVASARELDQLLDALVGLLTTSSYAAQGPSPLAARSSQTVAGRPAGGAGPRRACQ